MKTRKQVRTNYSFSRQVLLFLVFVVTFATNAQALSAQTKPGEPRQPTQATLTQALKTSFGSAVEAVTAFKPFYVTGDFNGDGAEDILIVVRLKGPRAALESDVKIYNPFGRPKAIFPDDAAANPRLALAIIHGSRSGWQTPPALEKFLMFGDSPVLILNNSRAVSTEPADKKGLMELLTKRSKRYKADGWPRPAAKGDSIVLGTEATDSILYWNGKNYRWEEAAGGE